MSRYIDAHRDRFGVEPICRVLEEATSTYYAARTRQPSARQRCDEDLLVRIRKVHSPLWPSIPTPSQRNRSSDGGPRSTVWVAPGLALLAELNRRIEDPDFRIGPSYFMKGDDPGAHSPERLDRIWRTSILPLLQEHHYGEWDSIKRRYQLSSILAAISGRPVGSAEVSEAVGTEELAGAGEGTPAPPTPVSSGADE